jgi:hypothetical protein
MSDSYVAHWSDGHRGKLVITDRAGNEVDSLAIPPGGDRPGPQVFFHAAWAPYPGSEWEEEPPGRWSVSVFCERPARNGSGGGT